MNEKKNTDQVSVNLKICDDNKTDSDAMILIKMFRSNVLGQLQFHELCLFQ